MGSHPKLDYKVSSRWRYLCLLYESGSYWDQLGFASSLHWPRWNGRVRQWVSNEESADLYDKTERIKGSWTVRPRDGPGFEGLEIECSSGTFFAEAVSFRSMLRGPVRLAEKPSTTRGTSISALANEYRNFLNKRDWTIHTVDSVQPIQFPTPTATWRTTFPPKNRTKRHRRLRSHREHQA